MTKPKKTTKPSSRKAKTTKVAGTARQAGSTKLAQLEAMLRRPMAPPSHRSPRRWLAATQRRGGDVRRTEEEAGPHITANEKTDDGRRVYRIAAERCNAMPSAHNATLQAEIAQLDDLGLAELRAFGANVLVRRPAFASTELTRRWLSWELQARAQGGLRSSDPSPP